jgi:hypothetical protein
MLGGVSGGLKGHETIPQGNLFYASCPEAEGAAESRSIASHGSLPTLQGGCR